MAAGKGAGGKKDVLSSRLITILLTLCSFGAIILAFTILHLRQSGPGQSCVLALLCAPFSRVSTALWGPKVAVILPLIRGGVAGEAW